MLMSDDNSDKGEASDDTGSNERSDDVIFTSGEATQRESPDDVPDYDGQWAANSAPEPDGDRVDLRESTSSSESDGSDGSANSSDSTNE